MKNINYYLKNEKRSFREFPFNNVDSLIFSTIAYLNLNNVVPGLFSKGKVYIRDISTSNIDEYISLLPDRNMYKEFVNSIVINPRFNSLLLDNYYEKKSLEEEMQFKALTIESDDFIYVSYMGTSVDLVSWKEDFNMSFIYPVPSQKLAVKYLNKVMFETNKRVFIGGHSKGGNLAIYAALNTLFFNKFRIKKVFSYDGPGFSKKVVDSKKYLSLKKKIKKIVPSSSIVGMLFNSSEELDVVKSSKLGLNQHSPFSWNIKKSDFIYLDDRSWASKHFDTTLSNWIDDLTKEQKIMFVDAIYKVLNTEHFDATNITERRFFKIYNSVRKGLKELDPDTKKAVIEVFKRLAYYEKLTILKKGNE